MSAKPCALCSSTKAEVFLNLGLESGVLLRCPGCGLVFLERTSSQPGRIEDYDETYWWQPAKKTGLFTLLEKQYRDLLLSADLRIFAQLLPGSGKILDVGCGNGDLLRLCRARGFDVYGLETSSTAAHFAEQENRVKPFIGRLAEAPFPWQSFDAIIFFHVLEHLADPVGELETARLFLKDGGQLIIQVPNINSLQSMVFKRRWFGLQTPWHLYHFSPASLASLLNKTGFVPLQVRHFSWRCNSQLFVYSLFPAFSPHEFSQAAHRGQTRLAAKIFCFIFTWLAAPLALIESILGRGAVITVIAVKKEVAK